MHKVTLDQSTLAKLGNLDQQLEICNETGQTLGYYLPASEDDPSLYQWAKTQITDEELERRRREPGGKTTAEILQRLEDK